MFITCQNCNTRYSIPDDALRSKGRTLKCTRCGHKWFQPADLTADDEHPSAAASIAEPSESRSQAESFAPPEELVIPTPPVMTEPFSTSFAVTSASVAEDPAVPTESVDPLWSDSGADEQTGPEPVPSPLPDITLSPSFEPTGQGRKSVDFDLMPGEPSLDELPSTLNRTADSRDVPRRKKSGFWWSCVGLVFVALAVFGAYAFQQEIIHRWPETAPYYEKTRLLQTDLPGAGLIIADQTVNWLTQDGTPSLVIHGTLVNLTSLSRPFPAMVFNLYSPDGKLRQAQAVPPLKDTISGGERYPFRYVLSDPDPSTAAITISFVAAVPPEPEAPQEAPQRTPQETPDGAVPELTPSPE